MTTNYLATAYPSNLVKFSATGNFSTSDHLQLITAKSRSLQLFHIEDEEIVQVGETRLPASVSGLWSFRPKNHRQDLLVVLTRRNEVFIAEITASNDDEVSIHTRASGKYPSSADLISLDYGPLVTFHPDSRVICLALFNQRFEIIQLSEDAKTIVASYPIRVDSVDMSRLICMEFLRPESPDTTVAFLQATNKGHLVSITSFDFKDKKKEKTNLTFNKLDLEASLLLPLPIGHPPAVLIVGNGSVQYYNTHKQYTMATSPFLKDMVVTAHCVLYRDPSDQVVTYLLAGCDGRLVLLICRLLPHSSAIVGTRVDGLQEKKFPPCRINVEFIGVVPSAQTLSVVSKKDGIVFIGTCAGPHSLLLRMRKDRNPETKFYFDVLQAFPAIGSIMQLQTLTSTSKQGLDQSCLLACTADTYGGSLTIIRSGINLENPTEISLAGMQKAWSLTSLERLGKMPVVVSDLTSTKVCVFEGEDLAEVDSGSDLVSTARTLLMAETLDGLIQVTDSAVHLLELTAFRQLAKYSPTNPEGEQSVKIVAASLRKNILLLAFYKTVQLVEVLKNGFELDKSVQCENEISAAELFHSSSGSLYCVVAEWKSWNVSLVDCSSATVIQSSFVTTDMQTRSLMYCDFGGGQCYLFCGLGDGNVDYFQFDDVSKRMVEPKRIPLGTRPVTFSQFFAHGQVSVFVASDRPCVVSLRGEKLLFNNVNIPGVVSVCPIKVMEDEKMMTDMLLVLTHDKLLLGQLEDIQKTHFIPVNLGFQAFRIAAQTEVSTIAVIGDRKDCRLNKFSIHKADNDLEQRMLYILDKNSFEVVTTYQCANRKEQLTSLCNWSPEGKPFLVIGTAMEGKEGNVIVQELINNRLQTLHTFSLTGDPVRNLTTYGKWLLVACDNTLVVFVWLGHQLEELYRISTGGAINYHLEVHNDTLLVGDVQKSIVMAEFNHNQETFEVIAKDYTGFGFMSLAIVDKETVIGGDDSGNMLTLRTRQKEGESGDGVAHFRSLEPASWICLGDPVTSIVRGSLGAAGNSGETSVVIKNSFVYGTCKGQLGIILELEQDLFELLRFLEEKITASASFLGGLTSSDSVQFCARLMEGRQTGFVDGDLLDTCLHMRKSEIVQLVADFENSRTPDEEVEKVGQPYTAAFVIKVLEDLSLLH